MIAERFLRFDADPVTTARRLLGQRLVHLVGGHRLAGLIVEVEAYLGPADRAAHTFGGRRSARNASMWRGDGHAYVYFSYGMHHCMNVVCGREGSGAAVLLRALEPTEGIDAMFARRPAARRETDLCSGPGRLAQALAIDLSHDGPAPRPHALDRAAAKPRAERGVGYAESWAAKPLRFFLRDNPHVSRARPPAVYGETKPSELPADC